MKHSILEKITAMTLDALLARKRFIAPQDYEQTFNSIAKNMGMNFENSKDYIDNTAPIVAETLIETKNEAKNLKVYTMEASEAVKNNDSSAFNVIDESLTSMHLRLVELEEKLYADELTGSRNRIWLNEKLSCGVKQGGGIAFLDLNNFKTINDTYGHLVGDEVLRYLARCINNAIETAKSEAGTHADAQLIRYAGDEFIITSEQHNLLDIIISRANTALLDQPFLTRGENSIKLHISFSYGIAKSDGQSMEHLIKIADERMYDNKKTTKDVHEKNIAPNTTGTINIKN